MLPAPFLAVRVFLQLVEDESKNYLTVDFFTKGRYVDDICGDAENLKELTSSVLQLVDLCKADGFSLAKWQSNRPDLLKTLSPDATSTQLPIFENLDGKILGLLWQTQPDRFIFSNKASSLSIITKRTILSEVVQLLDPLGFLFPVIIRAKMLPQELWLEKIGWDDSLLSTQESVDSIPRKVV